jgi:riboflavin kinase/FMN adenylyltransferase
VLIVDDFSVCPWPGERSIVTIGAYDGLHVGHRTVIDKVVERAKREGSKSVLVTFDRHPASLVRPESAPKLLTDHEQKIELLRGTGLDAVAVVRFDAEQAAESPQDFVTRVLVTGLGVAHIIVGSDFHFGRGRAGNVELLTTLGQRSDAEFTVEPVTLIPGHTGVTASSTEIRRLLTAGNIADANVMLGRPFELRGVVAHGDARGRTIGFPTANIEVPSTMCVPGDGVYAAWYVRPGTDRPLPAAVNIGRRPTFYENAPVSLIEAHVIDGPSDPTDLDLYGETAHVRFVARLRGEQKFSGLDELKAQLVHDIAAARDALRRV